MEQKQLILNMKIKENAGIGRIFRHLRKLKSLTYYSDFILFKRIILRLRESGFEISDRSIVGHFRNVSSYEYAQCDKHALLSDLKSTSLLEREV